MRTFIRKPVVKPAFVSRQQTVRDADIERLLKPFLTIDKGLSTSHQRELYQALVKAYDTGHSRGKKTCERKTRR